MTGTPQAKIDSGFAPGATALEVIAGIDLKGKNVIITGGYGGIGLETTKAFLAAGAKVIVLYRTEAKAKENLKGLDVEMEFIDLQDRATVCAFADKFLASRRPLHFLINDAAIMASPLARDSQGNEGQFSTNVLGHFALTVKLWPALVAAKGARIVFLSSAAHAASGVHFEDVNFEKRQYEPWQSYGQSKTGDALLAIAFDAKGKDQQIRAFSVHPGCILATDLGRFGAADREAQKGQWKAMGFVGEDGKLIVDPLKQLLTIPQGAATTVWAATSPKLAGKGGVYCESVNIAPRASEITPVPGAAMRTDAFGFAGVKEHATDPAAAQQLVALCEKLTGLKL